MVKIKTKKITEHKTVSCKRSLQREERQKVKVKQKTIEM